MNEARRSLERKTEIEDLLLQHKKKKIQLSFNLILENYTLYIV